MFDRIRKAVEILEQQLKELDPGTLHPQDVSHLLKLFSKGEKVCTAGKALVAARAASSGAWRAGGDRSPAHFVSRATGDSVGASVTAIETARRMAELPRAELAFKSGKLTFAQAAEVASAASLAPGKQSHLLQVAQTEGIAGLKAEARRVIAQACHDEKDKAQQIHNSRYLRTWTEQDGAFRLDARMTPEAGAQVKGALDHLRQGLYQQARRQGRKQSLQALDADALVQMAQRSLSAKPQAPGPKAVVNVRVDYQALKAGHTRNGEVCEIQGVGPISVAAARAYLSDCILKLLIRKGTKIEAIAHLGRTIPAPLRTVLTETYPECAIQGCHETKRLEIDHVIPLFEGGATEIGNLTRICEHHHRLKTYKGFRLTNNNDKWQLTPPPDRPARASPRPR